MQIVEQIALLSFTTFLPVVAQADRDGTGLGFSRLIFLHKSTELLFPEDHLAWAFLLFEGIGQLNRIILKICRKICPAEIVAIHCGRGGSRQVRPHRTLQGVFPLNQLTRFLIWMWFSVFTDSITSARKIIGVTRSRRVGRNPSLKTENHIQIRNLVSWLSGKTPC